MRNWIVWSIAMWIGGGAVAAGQEGKAQPLPLPKAVRVQSAGPRGQVWDRLSAKEKMLAFHLTQASRAGRDLLFYQTHRHSLTIKHWLQEALSAEHLQETRAGLGDRPF